MTAEDLAALQTDVLAGYVFAQAAAGPARPGRRRAPISPHSHMVKALRRCVRVGRRDELIFIRATASPGQLELLAGAVL